MKKNFWIIIGLIVVAVIAGVFLASRRGGQVAGEIVVGEAVVDEVSVVLLESFPIQAQATFSGNLPDGCTTIGDISQVLEGNTIRVRVTTQRDASLVCTQALSPYEKVVSLDILGIPAGQYTVDINGATTTFTLGQDNLVDFESDKGLVQ